MTSNRPCHVDRLIEGLGEYCPTSPPDCVYIASNENGTFHHISTDEVFASPWQFPEKLIPLYGDGQNGRDWLYAEDHVDALRRRPW